MACACDHLRDHLLDRGSRTDRARQDIGLTSHSNSLAGSITNNLNLVLNY